MDARVKSPENQSSAFRDRMKLRSQRRKASRKAIRLATRAMNKGFTNTEISEAVIPRDRSVAA